MVDFGSTETNDDMEAGRPNLAEDTTRIWAQRKPGSFFGQGLGLGHGDGSSIFNVSVAEQTSNPDAYVDSDGVRSSFTPEKSVDGIVGTGWSGGSASNFDGTPGAGVGVTGNGGFNQGTGVFGRGAGERSGPGGIGVHGVGGSHGDPFPIPPSISERPAGIGVVAQGGRHHENANIARRLHGAGLIAVAGGAERPLPPHTDTGGIGVWAKGSDAETTMVNPFDDSGPIPGPQVPSGPLNPETGVFGLGGVPIPSRGPVAAGVIGLAGGTTPTPDINQTGDTGVYGRGPVGVRGQGPTGVVGEGERGPGLHGKGMDSDSRGGIFQSVHAAQVQLVPHPIGEPPDLTSVTPTVVVGSKERVPFLPKNGRGGDLLTLRDNRLQCSLWFCVKGEVAGQAAQWAPVAVGPSFDGVA